VATDVAARGLDLPDLGLVIHADLPANKAGLLHRSGRTGRAGRKGVSVLLVPYTKRRVAERLLESASIEAEWSGPPSAEEIRAKDQARLLDDPILNEAPTPEDLALAARILADRSPEAVAAALIRLHRARLPEPEEVFDDVRDRGPEVREPRPQRKERRTSDDYATEGGGAWFRIAVGRTNNADPKWILPLICRVGHVTKKDIGEIRIFDRETKFEISAEAEPRFREAIKQASAGGDMRVEPAGPPGPRPPRSGPPRSDAPRSGPPRSGPPRSGPRPTVKPRSGSPPPHRDGPPPKGGKPKRRKANG
jgi:ATP-dependent RNA helicase DeaD